MVRWLEAAIGDWRGRACEAVAGDGGRREGERDVPFGQEGPRKEARLAAVISAEGERERRRPLATDADAVLIPLASSAHSANCPISPPPPPATLAGPQRLSLCPPELADLDSAPSKPSVLPAPPSIRRSLPSSPSCLFQPVLPAHLISPPSVPHALRAAPPSLRLTPPSIPPSTPAPAPTLLGQHARLEVQRRACRRWRSVPLPRLRPPCPPHTLHPLLAVFLKFMHALAGLYLSVPPSPRPVTFIPARPDALHP